jgi:Rrf2 family cysteine metabolism transcriptional repressor
MHFSLKSEYALLAIFDLALQPTREPVRIADVARRQKIPQKFLELILAGLKQGGFVESRRGAEGGYLLGRPPERITVGEVLRHVEGGKAQRSRPSKRGETPFTELWNRVDEAVAEVVDKTTVAELVNRWRERQAALAPTWDI